MRRCTAGGRFGRLIAVAVAALATGCASVPSGSQVVGGRVSGHEQPIDDPYVRIIPVGPERDQDPGSIVTAFRTASASFDGPNGEHQVAREYLACGSCWRPGVASIVYDQLPPSPVQFDGDQATRDRGRQPAGPDRHRRPVRRRPAQVQADLPRCAATRRSSGGSPSQPQALLLSRDDVDRAFRTLDLYFFAPDAQIAGPQPGLHPAGQPSMAVPAARQATPRRPDDLAARAPWSDSGFPPGTQLRRLDISGGVATVDLSRQAATGDLTNMSIQLMWTLRQLREVDQLKLEIEGQAGTGPRRERHAASRPSDWAAYAPDGIGDPPPRVRRVGRRPLRETGRRRPRCHWPKLKVSHPAVSYDGRQVAALDESGHTVTVTDTRPTPTRVDPAREAEGRRVQPPVLGHARQRVGRRVEPERLPPVGDRRRHDQDRSPTAGPCPVPGEGPAHLPRRHPSRRDRPGGQHVPGPTGPVTGRRPAATGAPSEGGLQAEGFIAISSELQGAVDLAWRDADHLAVVGAHIGQPEPRPVRRPGERRRHPGHGRPRRRHEGGSRLSRRRPAGDPARDEPAPRTTSAA